MVDVLRNYQPAIAWLESLGDEPALGLPGFVMMELIVGEKSKKDLKRLKLRLRPFNVYWPSGAHCGRALRDFMGPSFERGLGATGRLDWCCGPDPRSSPLHIQRQAFLINLGPSDGTAVR